MSDMGYSLSLFCLLLLSILIHKFLIKKDCKCDSEVEGWDYEGSPLKMDGQLIDINESLIVEINNKLYAATDDKFVLTLNVSEEDYVFFNEWANSIVVHVDKEYKKTLNFISNKFSGKLFRCYPIQIESNLESYFINISYDYIKILKSE